MNDGSALNGRPLTMKIKLAHGFGAFAFGIKDNGFSFFLMIYYNQVLGMDAGAVGLVLLLALLIDAVVDPILGNLSDRTYTKWGRRLPWLYTAPIPLAFAWVLLWSPPGGEAPSFMALLALAVTVRILLSACEVPSISLVPEITANYDDRTTLFRYRFLFGWGGGALMMILAYTVLMPGPDGLLQKGGYLPLGIIGAFLMVLSVIGSALGQHKLVARLPETKPGPFSLKESFSEIKEAFSERAFLIFAAGALAAYIAQGLTFSITNYLNLYVWRLEETELKIYPVILLLSVVLMFMTVGPMHRKFGKPGSAAVSGIGSLILVLLPYILLLMGFWPQAGSPLSTTLLYITIVAANMLSVVVMVSASSMVAEIVEAFEERSGRRAEGAFYSGNWLVQKCATGAGIFLTGQIIALSQLSTDAHPGAIPPEVLDNMIIMFCGAYTVLILAAVFWLKRFPISRHQHEARMAAKAAKAAKIEFGGASADANALR